jgi:hypothetical protein
MPIRPSKNVAAKYLEFDPAFLEEAETFAKKRGQSFKSVVVEALKRHMANPPPLPADIPLPPVPASEPESAEKPAGKRRKK